jgi:hypothetical protein
VGIFLGVLVFGDRVQVDPGELALQAGGIVALIVGVILVGRAPALAQLRRLTPPGLPHITGGLPTLPSLPGLAGRHSGEGGQADKDQAPHPGVEAFPNSDGLSNSHANGDGRHPGDGHHDAHPPLGLARAEDEPVDQPADHPNP